MNYIDILVEYRILKALPISFPMILCTTIALHMPHFRRFHSNTYTF